MEPEKRRQLDDCIAAVARLALWLAGDLVPESSDVVERDLDSLYELAVAAERQARDTFPNWQ